MTAVAVGSWTATRNGVKYQSSRTRITHLAPQQFLLQALQRLRVRRRRVERAAAVDEQPVGERRRLGELADAHLHLRQSLDERERRGEVARLAGHLALGLSQEHEVGG